jgi:aminopeptidase N
MLRRQIGDEAFWTGIHDYYHEYRDANALTEDLQRVMEEASEQDLEWFFRQWAYLPGHPILESTWSYDANAGRLTITVQQAQPSGAIFTFPLDIGISIAGETTTGLETVQISGAAETFSFAVDSAPTAVTLDPDTWLLFEGELSPQPRAGSRR